MAEIVKDLYEEFIESTIDQEDSDFDTYEVDLGYYNGPLDVLLGMIKKAKIDIKDIFCSKITEQYLAYIRGLDVLDLARTSSFLEVAATLIEIKSKSLLPKIEDIMPEDEEQSAEKNFIQRLEEYKMFKDAAEKMRDIENVRRFYREPDQSVGDFRIVLKQMTMEGLLNALSKLILKVQIQKIQVTPKQIKKDPFTVADKIEHISKIVSERRVVLFFTLFSEDRTRSEVITTFQALLELMKLQYVKVEQPDIYSDIKITYNEEAEKNAEKLEEAVLEIRSEEQRQNEELNNSDDAAQELIEAGEEEFNEAMDNEELEEFGLSIPFEDNLDEE